MQQLFPELTYLELGTDKYVVPTLPDLFLDLHHVWKD